MKQELTEFDRKRLQTFVRKIGIKAATEALECNRGTIASAIAGFAVHAGTVALIRNKLDEKGE